MKMTKHAQVDRFERLSYIVDCFNGDFGREVAVAPQANDIDLVLMSCGVIFVKNSKKNVLITGYIATIKEAIFIWRAKHGNHDMPDGVYKRIIENKPLHDKQPGRKLDIKFY